MFGHFLSDVPSVLLDYYTAGTMVTQHLLDAGHKQIALFTRENYQGDLIPGLNWASRDFWRGYGDTLDKGGMSQAVVSFKAEGIGPYMAAESLLTHSSKPTGVVCCNDWATSALLQYADGHPDHVPANFAMAVFGRCDSIFPRRWPVTVFPALVEQIGAAAAETAFQLVQKETVEDVALPPGPGHIIQK